ncbi:MAG TPA: tRNA pseudouridine(55) synthase TruB [Syntrophobacteraceae bacterium]|nr:tRNA pseudouridine(55) synthase TruB [Syntrophobacteraceae bacterium]
MTAITIQGLQADLRESDNDPLISKSPIQPDQATIHGVLLLDKPPGITSFAAVARVRKLLHVDKVGHCGTLDPFATGLLLICINHATRIVDQLLVQDKVYRCRVRLGMETDTLDHTGAVTSEYQGGPLGESDLCGALQSFCGTYVQAVPGYSAVRVNGRRLHQWTRQGVKVEVPTREVGIHNIELLSYEWPEADLEVHCSKGTYIRQLAADIGRLLGCGAHLTELRRLASGLFHLDRAVRMDQLEHVRDAQTWPPALIPLNEALDHLPALVVGDERALGGLSHGHLDASWEAVLSQTLTSHGPGPVRLVRPDRKLVALWWPSAGHGERRLRVFPSAG